MEQFSVVKYLETPNRKVVTRDGRSARIICTNRLGDNYQVLALVADGCAELCYSYTTSGKFDEHQNVDCELDLFFAPEKKEGWLNIYRSESGFYLRGNPYESKEEADEVAKANYKTFCATVKVEWEE